MDLMSKSKSWSGNIYHQLDSIFQEVDDFMSKDTVRFVENQVQNVGASVKRLYSNVVQDLIPLSKDNEKPESQSTNSEQATSGHEKQLSENQDALGNFRNSDASIPIEVESDVDEKITRVSLPLGSNSISDDVITEETERAMGLDHREENKGFLDDMKCQSNISSSDFLFESKLPTVEDLNCDENGSLSDPTVASAHKDGTLCDVSSREPESVCVDISCDEEEEDTGQVSSSSTSATSSNNILDYKSENFIENAENSCQSHVESSGSAYYISSPSFTAAAYETKAVDLCPDFLISESNDHAFHMDGSEFFGGSSEIEMSGQSETENTDEMFDLFPDMTRDETSLILSGISVHAATHGKRNFTYYKKLIQQALTSRKRLTKEYVHLAILYGDIDLESSQHFEPITVPSSMNTSLHAEGTQSFHEMSETEWELV